VSTNVRYASDSDHSGHQSETTRWATSGPERVQQILADRAVASHYRPC
jgi:hypothetical protein